MSWDDLANKRIPSPFVPEIKGELDVSNFSDEFTTMVPADSPAIVPVNGEKLFKVCVLLHVVSPVLSASIHSFQSDNRLVNGDICVLWSKVLKY